MNKKKTSRKQELTLDAIPKIKLNEEKLKDLTNVDPEDFFKDHARVGEALLQALMENDTEAFIEILDTYLCINRSRAARNANLSRTTVQQALSKHGNPTLKTIARIVHHEAGQFTNNRK